MFVHVYIGMECESGRYEHRKKLEQDWQIITNMSSPHTTDLMFDETRQPRQQWSEDA